ncbi:protein SLX4IP isoform X2 [Engystomops pustulosus]|uniref:protein SLX4IP isoform X2 n=1 Tax=Engystomops pustulosus TaxID=76066 RepID=UPI003AFB04CE
MMSNKLVVKCGNFAVLVDLHVLPQGTSKDSSWFSDHEKEEVCLLLKDTIDARVKQHIENRRQQGQAKHKEYTQASPLFLKELYVFPDRFVVCVSQLEPHSNTWAADTIKPPSTKESFSGRSEYFTEQREHAINNILPTAEQKQAALRNIVKKTKATKDSSPESGRDCKECPRLGRAYSDIGSEINTQCRSADHAEDCVNTTPNNLELPDAEVENDVNSRQPCRTSSQHKPQATERLQAQDPTKALSWICESAQAEEKQTLRTSIMQQKRRRHSSEGKATFSCKKADLRDDAFMRSTEEPKESTALRGEKGSVEQITVHKTVTSDNKLHVSMDSTHEVKNLGEAKKPPDGQPRKLKLQRPKKLH